MRWKWVSLNFEYLIFPIGKRRGDFKCTISEETFSVQYTLRCQKVTHRGEQPFKWDKCVRDVSQKEKIFLKYKRECNVRKSLHRQMIYLFRIAQPQKWVH